MSRGAPSRSPSRALWTAALLAAALSGLQGCAYDRVAERRVLQWYGVDRDVAMGEETLAEFLAALDENEIPYNEDERLLEEIRDIVRRVAAVSHYPELPWEAHLAEVRDVNAWATPGGKIVVYRGLFDGERGLVRTRHELAGILAHECAHVTARHLTRRRSRTNTLLVVTFPVQIALAVFAPAGAQAAGLAFDHGLHIYLPSYSRRQEEEADAIGLIYMAKAGYDPRAAVRVWRRAAERERGGGGLYDTHPDHASRADRLEELLPEALAIYEAVRAGRAP